MDTCLSCECSFVFTNNAFFINIRIGTGVLRIFRHYIKLIYFNIIKSILLTYITSHTIAMNATELEMIRQQSDSHTLIMMFILMIVFAIGGWLTEN